MSKEDKQHNLTFDIDSSSDEEITVTEGDGIFQRNITKIKKKSIVFLKFYSLPSKR